MISTMNPVFDLHCHSTYSDGLLNPSAVVTRAASLGVNFLALTDHDEVGGLDEAWTAAAQHHVVLVPGVEISASWSGQSIHIVGLGIDPEARVLIQGLGTIREGRMVRARRIAADLQKAGIPGSLEGACHCAANTGLVGRAHFARFLVDGGYVKDMQDAFRKYLVHGKPGYVPHEWISMNEAIEWITGSGGVAVLAHPGRYPFGTGAMRRLIAEFAQAGGQAIEVVTGNHTRDQYATFARYASQFGLMASSGSDFHGPGESRVDLGALPDLPHGCRPVWEALDRMGAHA